MKPKMAAVLLMAILSASCNQQGDAGKKAGGAGMDPNAPVAVGVVTLKSGAVPRYSELTGRVVAKATAEIRPQVDGIVQLVSFKEGGPINAGDVLYRLDDRKFKAALAAAQATLEKAQATEKGAQSTLDRNIGLAANKAVSEQTVQDARTTLLQAQADTESARADLQTAQINLDDSTIEAPISGIISISTVTQGALVTANQTTALATIRQIDPIQVDLVDTSANLLRTRDDIRKGILGRPDADAASVSLTLEDGEAFRQTGKISAADLNVSKTTGTFSLRAEFSNPEKILLPGMFVRAKVKLGVMPKAFLLPQRAVGRNAAGEATAFFVEDGKAAERILSIAGSEENNWLVTEGVKDGDQLIIDGLQKIHQGGPVKPTEVKIDDKGLVNQDLVAIPAAGAPAAGQSEVKK